MQQKHRTFYLLNVIRALAFGKERELKNEVSLRCFIFFSEKFCRVNSRLLSEKHTNNHIQTKLFSSIG